MKLHVSHHSIVVLFPVTLLVPATTLVKFTLEASAINNLYATKYYSSDKESIEAFATLEKGALLEIKPTNQNTGAIKFLKLYPSQQDTISKEINKKERMKRVFFFMFRV